MGGKNNKMKITVKKKKELIIYSDQIHSRFLINSNRGPPKPQKDCNFTIKFGFCCRFPFPFPFPAILQVRVGATPPVIPETYLSTHQPFRTHLNQSKCFNVISSSNHLLTRLRYQQQRLRSLTHLSWAPHCTHQRNTWSISPTIYRVRNLHES